MKKKKREGLWIPNEILEIKGLSGTDKIILSEIYSLCSLKDGCYASNSYFGNLLKMTSGGASKKITKLENLGLIKTNKKFENNKCVGRNIFKGSLKIKNHIVPFESDDTSICPIVLPNEQDNTSKGNTINTTTNSLINTETTTYTGATINNSIGSTNSTANNSGISMAEYQLRKLQQLENYLVANCSIESEILNFTSTDGIKELKYHIDNINEYEKLVPKLKEYLSTRKSLYGY